MAGLDPAIHGPRARHQPRGYPAQGRAWRRKGSDAVILWRALSHFVPILEELKVEAALGAVPRSGSLDVPWDRGHSYGKKWMADHNAVRKGQNRWNSTYQPVRQEGAYL